MNNLNCESLEAVHTHTHTHTHTYNLQKFERRKLIFNAFSFIWSKGGCGIEQPRDIS
jgi:hypothetical protein